MLQGSKMRLIYFFNYSVLLLFVIAEDWNLFLTYCVVLTFHKNLSALVLTLWLCFHCNLANSIYREKYQCSFCLRKQEKMFHVSNVSSSVFDHV